MERKIMKKILRFLPLVALLAGIFGVASTKTDSIRAEAAEIPPGQVLYLKPNENWLVAGARFAVYFFTDGAGNEWKDATKEAGVLDIYKVVAPTTSYQKLIFTRMNPATTENNWANKWDQTGDLDFDGTNNLFTIPSGAWSGATNTGNWSVYDPLDHPLPPTFEEGLPLFFKPTTAFMTGATRLAAHFFIADGGADPKWSAMTQVDTGIYQVITPTTGVVGKEYDRIIFVSMVADNTEDALPEFHWDYKVSQTTNLIYDGTNDLFDNSDLSWKTYVERPTVTLTATTEGVTSSKVRIWLDRSGHYEEGYTWAMKIGTTLYQPTGFEKALKLTGSDRFFAYYDMPTSVLTGNIGFSVVNSFLKVEVEIPAVAFTTGDNNKVWKVDYVSEAWTLTKGAITERIYNTFFAKVLEGYLTCDANAINGYGAFEELDANFLPRVAELWNMEGLLSDVNINDYMYQMDYSSGFRPLEVNAYDKYLALQAYYDAANPAPITLNFDSNAQITTLIIIALAGILTLAGYILLRKRYRLIK
jgi:hypothetical protein